MKGLAFAYDPDGYWVEIVEQNYAAKIPNYFTFSQTMMRIKDPSKTIPFYEALGMKLLGKFDLGTFTLFFLASNCEATPEDELGTDETRAKLFKLFHPFLEFTHNHGTENDLDFKYYNGNESGRQGFGHIGFLVDDVYKACDSIRTFGYGFKKVSFCFHLVRNQFFLGCFLLDFTIT